MKYNNLKELEDLTNASDCKVELKSVPDCPIIETVKKFRLTTEHDCLAKHNFTALESYSWMYTLLHRQHFGIPSLVWMLRSYKNHINREILGGWRDDERTLIILFGTFIILCYIMDSHHLFECPDHTNREMLDDEAPTITCLKPLSSCDKKNCVKKKERVRHLPGFYP